MLCDLDVPLLFVATPVMDMRPPLKADRLYMENRIEGQNAVAHMVQSGKKRISFAGDKKHCQSFFERYIAYKDAVEYFGLTAVSYTHLDVYKRQGRSLPACSDIRSTLHPSCRS